MNRKVKVVHFTQSLGGVETSIRLIIGSVDSDKIQSIFISPTKNIIIPDDKGKPIDIYSIIMSRSINPLVDIAGLIQCIILIFKLKPDIVHCHSSKAGIIGRLAARIVGVKTFFSPHAFSFLSTDGIIIKKIYIWIERLARKLTTLLVACSESEYNHAVNHLKFSTEHCVIWKNSIALNKIKEIIPVPATMGPYLCSIGRPSFQKNVAMQLEVLELLRNNGFKLKCVLLGVGHHSPEKNRINALIYKKRLQDVFLMKEWCSHEETLQFLKASELFILTSRYEGLPFSILEAMALGKVVVATDVDGSRDCVIERETGYIVPLNDSNAMFCAIRKILADKNLKMKFETNAQRIIGQFYNIQNNIHYLENYYNGTVTTE